MNHNSTKAVIFDLDGVIVDTEPLHKEAWRRVFEDKKFGIEESTLEHELTLAIGITDISFLNKLFSRYHIYEDPHTWLTEKREIYYQMLPQRIKPFPGVISLIEELSTKYSLAIASNASRRSIHTVISHLSLRDYFRIIAGRENIHRHKPKPEIFFITAEKLGVEPSACVVIEDSIAGVESAKNARMRCIAVTNSLPSQKLARADLIVDSLERKKEILNFLGEGD